MRHSLLAILASLAILITHNHLCFAQTNTASSSQMNSVQADAIEKLKKQVKKIGVGRKITVFRLDKREFYGSVRNIESDGFQIDEVDLKQVVSFKYTKLQKVRKDYGGINHIAGKRVNKRRELIVTAAIVGGVALMLGIVLSGKD